jgi:ferrous iron transport protein A
VNGYLNIHLNKMLESVTLPLQVTNDLQLHGYPMKVSANTRTLGSLRPGQTCRVIGMADHEMRPDLEERLLRMGFAEDARIEVRHEGPVGRDPMAVKVDGVILALRRREADTILVEVDPPK